MIEGIMYQINTLTSSPTQKDSPKPLDPATLVPANRRDTLLDGGHSTKICGMWTLKHDNISPKSYERLIKTEIKVGTALYLNNFYKHINMFLNLVTIIKEDLLTAYQYIDRNSEFAEYFIPDSDHPSYHWNVQIYNSFGQ